MSTNNKKGSNKDIPIWASVWKDDGGKEKGKPDSSEPRIAPLTLEQEEAYVRTRAYQSIAAKIDAVVEAGVNDDLLSVVNGLKRFFSVDEFEESPPLKRTRLEVGVENSPETSHDFVRVPVLRKDPCRLPIAMLQGPASILDRRELFRFLVDMFRNQQDLDSTPAVCCLAKIGEAVANRNDCAPLLREIVLQCIHQEPDPLKYSKLLKRGDALLKWARKTTEFDSIVVFLEDVEGMPTFQDLLHHLAELRATHGIRINVVVLAPVGNVSLRSSTQGRAGLALKCFSLPRSDDWMARVWSTLSREAWVSPASMRFIRASFVNHTESLVKSATMLKTAVAHVLLEPGSFAVARRTCPEFAQQERHRLEWLDTDPEAREFCGGETTAQKMKVQAKEALEKHQEQRILCRVVQCMLQQGRSFDAAAIIDEACWGLFQDGGRCIKAVLCEGTATELFQRLQGAMDILSEASAVSTMLESFVERLDSFLIALLGEIEEGRTEASKSARLVLEALTNDFCQRVSTLRRDLQREYQSHLDERTMSAISPEVRAVVANQLLTPDQMPAGSLFESASQLFDLMKDTMAVSRTDFFDLYRKRVEGRPSQEELWLSFALGIYHLIHLGFIREKPANGRLEAIYEKAAVVWGRGL